MASTTRPTACRRLLGARLVAKHSKTPSTTWQVHDTDPIAPGAPVLPLTLSQTTTPVGSKQAGATHWSAENE